MPLRLPQSLHDALKRCARLEGVSLNQYCLYLLARYSGNDRLMDEKKAEELLTFLEEAQHLQKELRPEAKKQLAEAPKETPISRWKKLHG